MHAHAFFFIHIRSLKYMYTYSPPKIHTTNFNHDLSDIPRVAGSPNGLSLSPPLTWRLIHPLGEVVAALQSCCHLQCHAGNAVGIISFASSEGGIPLKILQRTWSQGLFPSKSSKQKIRLCAAHGCIPGLTSDGFGDNKAPGLNIHIDIWVFPNIGVPQMDGL